VGRWQVLAGTWDPWEKLAWQTAPSTETQELLAELFWVVAECLNACKKRQPCVKQQLSPHSAGPLGNLSLHQLLNFGKPGAHV
jgi:hypothetical protein